MVDFIVGVALTLLFMGVLGLFGSSLIGFSVKENSYAAKEESKENLKKNTGLVVFTFMFFTCIFLVSMNFTDLDIGGVFIGSIIGGLIISRLLKSDAI